jgi:hypothetical protein
VSLTLGFSWPALTTVGGELAVVHSVGSALKALPVGASSVGARRLENNTILTGTSIHVVGAGPSAISGDPALSECEVNTFLAAQQAAGWTGAAVVSDTVPCP